MRYIRGLLVSFATYGIKILSLNWNSDRIWHTRYGPLHQSGNPLDVSLESKHQASLEFFQEDTGQWLAMVLIIGIVLRRCRFALTTVNIVQRNKYS